MIKFWRNILCFLVFACASIISCHSQSSQNELNLAGPWEVALDSLSQGPDNLTFADVIKLPGYLEDSMIGNKKTVPPAGMTYLNIIRTMLMPNISFVGKAWYRKTITVPSSTKGKKALLVLGSVMWRSTVFVDGKLIGTDYSLSVPHRYYMSEDLTPGKHTLLICIDNSRQINIQRSGRNGITGDLKIRFLEPSYISGASVFPDAENKRIRIKVKGVFNPSDEKLLFSVAEKAGGRTIAESEMELNSTNEYILSFTPDVSLWNEFKPALYTLNAVLIKGGKKIQLHTETFGFRKIESKGKQLVLNGFPLFLRGTLGGGGGTSPVDWAKIYRKSMAYGINHYRFHSHCPPEAAFDVADKLGIYLQVECPIWSLNYGKDTVVVNYINAEARRIIEEYGNHPSFILMSTGNEMEGDFKTMNDMMADLSAKEDRMLFTTTSFTFQKGHGEYPEPADEFFVTQWTDNGWVRGQGYFDVEYPRFDRDYSEVSNHIPVPLITHEVGQHTAYPDVRLIDKYDGNLTRPVGLIAIKNELEKKGLLPLADKFVYASGKLQVLLYKEEIERCLKTYGISGFQLLGLKDIGYPTGVIDALWNVKSYVDSTDFRHFCSEVVPLTWFRKSVLYNNETFNVEVGIANFYQPFSDRNLICDLSDHTGNVIARKKIAVKKINSGAVEKFGIISFDLTGIKEASQLSLTIKIEGTEYMNSWPIWVYPEKPSISDDHVLITSSYHEAVRALDEGRNVLLSPPQERIKGNPGIFITVFWAPTHFEHWERVSEVGTMGLLLNPEHPAFTFFPTEEHSNWQWWDLCKNSQTIDFRDLEIQPLVRVIDNYNKNRYLTNLFEVKAGKGKLIFSSIDLISDLDNRIEARQLRHSLIKYMNSSQFNPEKTMTTESLIENFEVRENWVYPAAKYRVIKRSDPNYPGKVNK